MRLAGVGVRVGVVRVGIRRRRRIAGKRIVVWVVTVMMVVIVRWVMRVVMVG